MAIIEKAKETMTARERVKRTFQFEKTDRVPIGYEANAGINEKLMKTLGAKTTSDLLDILGVDYRCVGAPYIGKQLFEVPEGRHVDQLEGSISRYIEHSSGGYWDFCDFPLQDAEDEDFENFPVPNPDDFNYDIVYEQAKSYQGKYALFIGCPGVPDIINSNGRLMGMEDVLCNLITEHEAALDFIHRRVDFQLKNMERTLEAAKGEVDFMWLGEDLGTQHTPMISLDLYRKIFKPIHKQFVDLAKSFDIPVLVHTCGSSSWVYEDFIDIGVRGVDTLQPEATNMSPSYLAEHFGGRLNFRGCISTAGPMAYGTADETEEQCIYTLETLMPYRGYHFAPTHCIQDNAPVENVIRMYNAAHKYGVYQ